MVRLARVAIATVVLAASPAWADAIDPCWAEAASGFAEQRLDTWREAPKPIPGVPDDLAAFLIGAGALFEGRYDDAATALETALEVPSSPVSHVVRVVLPEVLLRAGRVHEAAMAATDVLDRYPALPWRERVLVLRAAAWGAAGDFRRAASDLSRVPPDRAEAAGVLRVAACLPAGVSASATTPAPVTLEGARRAFARGQWERAIAGYHDLTARPGGAALEGEALGRVGRSLFRLGRIDEAYDAYALLWERHRARSGLSWAIKTAFMAGKHARGLEYVRIALATTGDVPATRARLMEYLTTFGHYREALALKVAHLRQGERERKAPRRSSAELWQLGWLLFRTSQPERALAAFEACFSLSSRADERQRVRYWIGRVREARGDRRRAAADYAEAATGGDRYYRLLATSRQAALRVGGLVLAQAEPLVDRLFDGARLIGPAADTDALTALPRRADDLPGAFLESLPDLPETRAARFLLEHGRVAAARDYARQLVNRLRAVRRVGVERAAGMPVLPVTDWRGPDVGHWGETVTPVAGARRARKAWLADRAALRALIAAGRDLIPSLVPLFAATRDEAPTQRYLEAWRDLRQVAPVPSLETGELPLAYRAQVLAVARAEGLDPFLVWAIVARESAFDERVVSPAGAMGLCQVMPETGARLAALLEPDGGAWDPLRLYDPETALRFGARYLRLLLERFRGQEPLAIAAYNAGPHYIAAWAQQKPGIALDAFVEEIPFDENRAYVRRVIGSWVAYRERYGFGSELYLSNRVDSRVSDGVSF